jgi:hypothetical protein
LPEEKRRLTQAHDRQDHAIARADRDDRERLRPHIPETAPWLAEYLHEVTVFPNGKHDDQVDATAQFLDWVKHPSGGQAYFELMRTRIAGGPNVQNA